ncbi:hypothetical protein PG991_012280 [Apiospora marii]|uniref:Uncharacterized protein n=1 Tax=Apiospora marii TaxID=335849 RepID=A0ABR1R9E2_9PEZI
MEPLKLLADMESGKVVGCVLHVGVMNACEDVKAVVHDEAVKLLASPSRVDVVQARQLALIIGLTNLILRELCNSKTSSLGDGVLLLVVPLIGSLLGILALLLGAGLALDEMVGGFAVAEQVGQLLDLAELGRNLFTRHLGETERGGSSGCGDLFCTL